MAVEAVPGNAPGGGTRPSKLLSLRPCASAREQCVAGARNGTNPSLIRGERVRQPGNPSRPSRLRVRQDMDRNESHAKPRSREGRRAGTKVVWLLRARVFNDNSSCGGENQCSIFNRPREERVLSPRPGLDPAGDGNPRLTPWAIVFRPSGPEAGALGCREGWPQKSKEDAK